MNKEREGYRATPGTSIVLRLDPGKLGALDLRGAVEKYLFGSRVPVYYNDKRIGWTYEEVMRAAHKEQGEKLYELTPKMKAEFDRSFPAVSGQYPKLAVSVIPLDTEEDQVLPEFSGVLVKYGLRFGQQLQWKVKDQTYVMRGGFDFQESGKEICLRAWNKIEDVVVIYKWEHLQEEYGSEKLAALEAEFAKYSRCPKAEDMMEAWEPFSGRMYLEQAWKSYHDNQQEREVAFSVAELGCPDIVQVCSGHPHGNNTYVYRGILAGDMKDHRYKPGNDFIVFLVEGAWRPAVDVSRSRISELPLYALLVVNGILFKYQVGDNAWFNLREGIVYLGGRKKLALEEWRELKDSRLDKWFQKNLDNVFLEMKQMLQRDVKDAEADRPFLSIGYHGDYMVVYKYFRVYLQDKYRMTIQYEAGQILSFYGKEEHERDEAYDLFPPMMFCLAASDESRQYVCSASRKMRRGITADHPFVIWLLHHAAQLKQYYQRQFEQIVDCLCNDSAVDIIEVCNRIRGQLLDFPERHGIDMGSFPKLGMDDFWPSGEE